MSSQALSPRVTGTVPGSPATSVAGIRALYVHIPFCERKCEYCDFTSVAGLRGERAYMDALSREIRMLATQCPGIVLCDLLLSEGRLSVDPKDLDFAPVVDRGELITTASSRPNGDGVYKRYKITESGISPRAIPGVAGYTHTAASDEHDEDGILISDEFTNPTKRRAMMEKRMRKVAGIEAAVPPPVLWGPPHADVTLIGWGSTKGVIEEACEILTEQGISANQLQIRWLVPLHGDAILDILKGARHTTIVENNYSGQFARYLRSETSFVPDGYIRKYDGEPFMPHHIVEAVKEQLSGKSTLSVPAHEILV